MLQNPLLVGRYCFSNLMVLLYPGDKTIQNRLNYPKIFQDYYWIHIAPDGSEGLTIPLAFFNLVESIPIHL